MIEFMNDPVLARRFDINGSRVQGKVSRISLPPGNGMSANQ